MSQALALLTSEKMRGELAKLLNSKAMIDRAIRLGTSALNNPDPKNKLPLCSAESFAGAFIKSIQLNLEPNTVLGECYLIPRQNKGKWEANFELGYKGLIKLAYRSNEVKLIQAHEVFDNDIFEADYGESRLVHKPCLKGPRGHVIAYWARYILKDGSSDFAVWTVDQIEEHKNQYSKSANSDYSPWNTAFDQMAKKTVIKDVLRYAAMSVEDMRVAMAVDQTVVISDNPDLQSAKGVHTTMDIFTNAQPLAEPTKQDEQTEHIDDLERQRMDVFSAVEKIIKTRKDAGAVDAEIENTIGFKLHEVEAQDMKTLLKIDKDVK